MDKIRKLLCFVSPFPDCSESVSREISEDRCSKYIDGRAPLLDLFRIILCMGVFVYHLTPERCSSGPLSVNGFLVLSGFLVGVSVFSCDKFDAERFYRSKCWRLLPMAVMAFIAGFIFQLWKGAGFPEWTVEQWVNFSFVNYAMHFNTPMWYMVIEGFMLLLVPFFVFVSRTRYCSELCLLGVFFIAWYLFNQVPENAPFGAGLYFSPLVRLWQFFAAILVGRYLVNWGGLPSRTGFIFKVAVLILFACFCVAEVVLMILKQGADLNHWNYTFEFDVLTTACYLILVPCLYVLPVKLPRCLTGILYWGALLTYPIFLIHVVARDLCVGMIGKFFGLVPYINIACATFVISLIAAGCLMWLDKRILRMRRK